MVTVQQSRASEGDDDAGITGSGTARTGAAGPKAGSSAGDPGGPGDSSPAAEDADADRAPTVPGPRAARREEALPGGARAASKAAGTSSGPSACTGPDEGADPAGSGGPSGPARDGSAGRPRPRRMRRFRAAVAPLLRPLAPLGPLLRHPVAAPVLLATALHLLWFWFVASSGGDLAAQDAWAEFVGRHPDSAYNLAWYGGLHPFSYSVLSPYLMAAIGVRTTLILAGILSAGLLGLLLRRVLRRPLAPALWGAFSFACDAASGRVTFALGALFGLGAVALVWAWPRRWWRPSGGLRWTRGIAAALLAALATMGSPVDGLFLEVVAAALFLEKRRQGAYAIAVAPPLVVGVSAIFFPFQGMQPMPWWSVLFPLIVAGPLFFCVPRSWRTVRIGAAVYALGVVLTWLIPSQVGSNVERLGLLFGCVAILAAAPLVVRDWRSTRGVALAGAFVVTAGWQVGVPTYDVLATTPKTSWAHELAPLTDQLKKVDADRGRVEVVPARSHREASALVPYVNLARGWNRQADTDRNPIFYENGGLNADSYHRWLQRWAVRYVVLPADPPDPAGAGEARIVKSGQPYLHQVWGDANWRLYRVADPKPLADPPARVRHAGADGVTVRVRKPGSVLVRIPWSPWLGLVDARGHVVPSPRDIDRNRHGCLREARPTVGGPPPQGAGKPVKDTWTLLDAPHAGTYRLAAPYRLPRGTACPDADTGGHGKGGGGAEDGGHGGDEGKDGKSSEGGTGVERGAGD